MNAQELTSRLRGADPQEPSELYELARELSKEGHEPARVAIQLWLGPDSALSAKARTLLDALEDLALVPLSKVRTEQPPVLELLWWMQNVTSVEVGLRRQIGRQLRGLLENKAPIPKRPRLEPVEETDPARRVCDEAYLHLRQLVHLDETQEDYLQNRRTFLHLPDALKDAEIKKVQQGKQWAAIQDSE